MKKQFLVLGAGKFGQSIALRLQELEQEVMIVDRDMETIQQLSDSIKLAVQGDVTHEGFLRELGVRNFDVVIISLGADIQGSIMVTLLLKELGCQQIVAKAESDLHAKVLYKIGANRVVLPEKEMGSRVAQSLVNHNILDYINLSKDYSIVELKVLPSWIGKPVAQINPRGAYGLNILAIKNETAFTIRITGETRLQEHDVLLVIGETDQVERLSRGAH